jgi:hypothetical protein
MRGHVVTNVFLVEAGLFFTNQDGDWPETGAIWSAAKCVSLLRFDIADVGGNFNRQEHTIFHRLELAHSALHRGLAQLVYKGFDGTL